MTDAILHVEAMVPNRYLQRERNTELKVILLRGGLSVTVQKMSGAYLEVSKRTSDIGYDEAKRTIHLRGVHVGMPNGTLLFRNERVVYTNKNPRGFALVDIHALARAKGMPINMQNIEDLCKEDGIRQQVRQGKHVQPYVLEPDTPIYIGLTGEPLYKFTYIKPQS